MLKFKNMSGDFKFRMFAYWLNMLAFQVSMFFGNKLSHIVGVSNIIIAILLWYSIDTDFKEVKFEVQ